MYLHEAMDAVYAGNPVNCTADEYQQKIRRALQDYAGRCVDSGDSVRAQIALMEVARLDSKFSFTQE